MTLDKHQLDGIGGFSEKVLPANQTEQIADSISYGAQGRISVGE